MDGGRYDRPAHTYSVVAVDRSRGEIGVAVQSHWFSVGSTVPWIEAGIGAVATQSFVNRSFGPQGLELLTKGLSPQEVVRRLIAADEGRQMRQLAVIDARGRAAAYTGASCVPEAGHLVGDCYSVQANLMERPEVWPAMARAFEASGGPLAERLVGTLAAAQSQGGDLRGRQSAALLVVRAEATGAAWKDRLIDLRVEDHQDPVVELGRLLQTFRAYEHLNRADQAMEDGDWERALREYGEAQALCPNNPEMKFWCAVSLANAGRVKQATPLFTEVFRAGSNWRLLAERLYKRKFLAVEEDQYRRIVSPEGRGC